MTGSSVTTGRLCSQRQDGGLGRAAGDTESNDWQQQSLRMEHGGLLFRTGMDGWMDGWMEGCRHRTRGGGGALPVGWGGAGAGYRRRSRCTVAPPPGPDSASQTASPAPAPRPAGRACSHTAPYTLTEREREKARARERETDRQTDRQTENRVTPGHPFQLGKREARASWKHRVEEPGRMRKGGREERWERRTSKDVG